MPTPVSCTLMRTWAAPAASSSSATRTTTSPSAVNLTALPTRLATTCRSRNGSPRSIMGASCGMNCRASSRPLAAAGCANMASASSTASTRLKSVDSSARWPDSIFEKSRMSLITPNRWRPEACTASAQARWCGCRGLSISSSFMPSTPFMGVRISWLMVARNCDFAWLASSACSLAARSSAVRRCTVCSMSARAVRSRSRAALVASKSVLTPW